MRELRALAYAASEFRLDVEPELRFRRRKVDAKRDAKVPGKSADIAGLLLGPSRALQKLSAGGPQPRKSTGPQTGKFCAQDCTRGLLPYESPIDSGNCRAVPRKSSPRYGWDRDVAHRPEMN